MEERAPDDAMHTCKWTLGHVALARCRSDLSALAVLYAHDRYCRGLGRVLVLIIHRAPCVLFCREIRAARAAPPARARGVHARVRGAVVRDGTMALWIQTVEQALEVFRSEAAHEPQPTRAVHKQCITDPPVADWYFKALKASNDKLTDQDSRASVVSCPDASLPHAGGAVQPLPGNDSGRARPIPRLRLDQLTPIAFYKHFIREGMPAVITGLFDDNRSFWDAHSAELERLVLQSLSQEDRATDESKRCQGESACYRAVHFADDTSRAYAALKAENVPKMLHFPDPLPREMIIGQMAQPFSAQVILTFNGGIFGGPLHYDMSCAGTISIQYKGVKKWSLWAPWDVRDDVPAHTRYEGIVGSSEFVWFPPAWYHGTEVLSERSLTAAHFVQDVPNFGAQAHLSLWRQPYGFERCAAGAGGWRARAAAWDFLIAQRRRERRRNKAARAAAEQEEAIDMNVVEQVDDKSQSSAIREPPHVEL